MNKQNLGTFEYDKKDTALEAKLQKFIKSLQKNDLTYNPFKKVIGK